MHSVGTTPLTDLDRYAELQRQVYDQHSRSRASAEGMVAPGYEQRREEAVEQARWVMNEHLRRRPDPGAEVDSDLRILDFACGVGRVMEAFVDLGFRNVDGVDISEAMLGHARESPQLQDSRFFLTSGHDCGDAPVAHYDLAYSLICLNHISMRQTRISIMRSVAQCLKPGGTAVFEFFYYPTIESARIPLPHVPWSANVTSPGTNSEADVWLTPDTLGELHADMRLWFRDVGLQEIEVWDNPALPDPSSLYPVRRNPLLAAGTVGRTLARTYRGYLGDGFED